MTDEEIEAALNEREVRRWVGNLQTTTRLPLVFCVFCGGELGRNYCTRCGTVRVG